MLNTGILVTLKLLGYIIKNRRRVNIFSIVIAIIWTLAILTSLVYNINNITKKQHHLVLEHAKNAFEKDLMFRRWVAMHGGVYVFPTKKTPPSPYLAHIPNRDLETTMGDKLTLMNPAYTLRELMENFSGMYGEKGHITSLKLLNPNNKPDEWEIKALKGFDAKKYTQTHEIYNYKGSKHLRYMRALVVKPSCLKCHAHQGYIVGNTRGGVSITIPMKKYRNDGILEKKNVIYLHLIILILSFIIGIITYKKVLLIIEKELKVEKELYHKDKLLFEQSKMASMGEMIGNIAHQWRQPLNAISLTSNNLSFKCMMDDVDNKLFQKELGLIEGYAQYLSKTIDDFRNFIKGDRTKSIFILINTINNFKNLVDSSIKNNYLNVIFDIDKDIKINGYENELIQCLINIFNNAKDILVEKEIEDKFIFISTSVKDNKAIIKIKDNAGGIPKDILPKIFEPYFTTKHQSLGTGLGLHITYNLIVDGMNGTIEANNVKFKYNGNKYTGAEFVISLTMS